MRTAVGKVPVGAWRIAALAAVLVLAAGLRLRGIGFGLPALLDPDEPVFVLIGLKLLKEHTLNPGWFGHPGTTTIYTMALVEAGVFLVGHLTGRFPDARAFTWALYHDPGIVFLPGRVVILLAGLLTIALAYRLARHLFGVRVALLASLLLAIDPVHIRYSQIIRTDMQEAVFILLVMLAAVRIAERGWRRDYLVAGAWLGVACATKWPAGTAAAGVLAAAMVRAAHHATPRAVVLRRLSLFLAMSVATCIFVSPYLLLDLGTVLADLHGEGRRFHLGATGYGFLGNMGWYLSHPLIDAMGVGGVALALLGFVTGTRRRPDFAVIGITVLAFLVSLCAQHLAWERWVVPLLPLLAIAAAHGAIHLFDLARARAPKSVLPVGAALAATLAPAPLRLADAQAAERAADTRGLATAWARTHLPAGSTVGIEYLAFDVLEAPWRFLYPAGDHGCVDVRANLARRITVSTIGHWRGRRPIIDFGGIGSAEAATCRADYVILANYDRYLAEAGHFPTEVANYRRLVIGARPVAVFRPRPGAVGGPVVRIYRLPR